MQLVSKDVSYDGLVHQWIRIYKDMGRHDVRSVETTVAQIGHQNERSPETLVIIWI